MILKTYFLLLLTCLEACVIRSYVVLNKIFLLSIKTVFTELIGLEWSLEIIQSSPPARQGYLEQVKQEPSMWVVNISREGELHDFPGQLFQFSAALKRKKFSLILRWNCLCFSLWPLLLLSLGTTEKSVAPSS